jgi:hypothetical protein
MIPLIRAQREGADVAELAISAAKTYARQGDSLSRYLDDLDLCLQVGGSEPAGRELLEATQSAWAEVFTARYDDVSCLHEPSGLTTVHHLQRHVRYRLPAALALIVVEVAGPDAHPLAISAVDAELTERLPEAELHVHLSHRRRAALVPRNLGTGLQARALKRALRGQRVWVETLPTDPVLAAMTIDELCR